MLLPIVVTSALMIGQVPDVPATPAPDVSATPTPVDRWLLMRWSQGSWPGWLLESEQLRVSGWTQANFTASSVADKNLPLGMNYLANQGMLEQNWLRCERPVQTSGTTQPTFGFRSDTILPGTDYRFTAARGLFSGQLTDNHGEPNTYGVDPVQFYGEAYLPTVGQGLDLKLGRFFALYGIESIDGISNQLASHSYTDVYDPFTHTGLVATLQLTKVWTFQAGLVLGSDVFIDPASQPTFIGSVKWAPPNGQDSVQYSVIVGSGRFNQGRNFNNPDVFDLIYIHQFNNRLSYSLESLLGLQSNVPNIGQAHWVSLLNYLTYAFTPKWSGTLRMELFHDAEGQRTGFAGLYETLTAGFRFQPVPWAIFRPEVRYDYNEQTRPYEGNHGLFTATADVIFRW